MGVTPRARVPVGQHVAVAGLLRPAAALRFEETCLLDAHIAGLELEQTRCRYRRKEFPTVPQL
jgi:hypothetical protein